MLNKDINSRFEDWLLSPKESLDFEVKQWLDMDNVESQGLVAKALIALENHGGGFLLFGYLEDTSGKLAPDPNRPPTLERYLADSLNNIVKRRAEPSFHVEVTLQRHPDSGLEYPLVRALGQSKVPVRSDSATPGGALKGNTYYIRASGPESRSPSSAAEWDALIRRAVANQREEIVALLRNYLPPAFGSGGVQANYPEQSASGADDQQLLGSFVTTSVARWSSLNHSLPDSYAGKITLGFFHFAARVVGKFRGATAQSIIQVNQSARRYTGWPVFATLGDEQTRPRLVDGVIEAWLAHASHPDPGHADFWRIDSKGNFFLLRGYQEDSVDQRRGFADPGKLFEATLPIWRLGEFLLRVVDVGAELCDGDFEVLVDCEWRGLMNRQLFVHNSRRFIGGSFKSAVDVVRTTGKHSSSAIRELLPDVVKSLTFSLYEHFDFFIPPDSMYREELGEMLKNRF